MAESYRRWSPYHYAVDNPIRYIDPDGRSSQLSWGQQQMGWETDEEWDRRNGGAFSSSFYKSIDAGDSTGGGDNNSNITIGDLLDLFNAQNGNPIDMVFMIGGADLFSGIQGKSDTTLQIEKILEKLTNLYVSSNNHDYFRSNSKTTQNYANFIEAQHSILKGNIILYGYSRGGVEIMEVARLLEKKNISVKLMILVDAANGKLSGSLDRTIPTNVKNVINYYETDGNRTNVLGSHGAPAVRNDGTYKFIQNFDVTGSYFFERRSKISSIITHSNIDEAFMNEVIYNIIKFTK